MSWRSIAQPNLPWRRGLGVRCENRVVSGDQACDSSSMSPDCTADHEDSQKESTSSKTASTGGGFASLGISPALVSNLRRLNLTDPRPVQRAIIPPLMKGEDVIALAETGSGKTAAFLAPILQRLLSHRPPPGDRWTAEKRLRALVLAPTRELAEQTGDLAAQLVKGTVLRTGTVVGTVSVGPQRIMIQQGVDLLVATPGRLNDLIADEACPIDAVMMLVLDEADRLFDLGFAPQVERLQSVLPATRQTVLLTATMPTAVASMARGCMRSPRTIEVDPHTTAVEHVQQHVVILSQRRRIDFLLHLLKEKQAGRMIIFCRTRRRTGWVAAALARHAIRVGQLHGDRSQAQRRRALKEFQEGHLDVIVSTDVGSRGLHIEAVRTVVNYDMPADSEDLVHRTGRVAHGTRESGDVWTLCRKKELDQWYDMAHGAGIQCDPETIPGISDSVTDQKAPQRGMRRRHETRKRPGPGRRKQASRRIPPDQRPGRGVLPREE